MNLKNRKNKYIFRMLIDNVENHHIICKLSRRYEILNLLRYLWTKGSPAGWYSVDQVDRYIHVPG